MGGVVIVQVYCFDYFIGGLFVDVVEFGEVVDVVDYLQVVVNGWVLRYVFNLMVQFG